MLIRALAELQAHASDTSVQHLKTRVHGLPIAIQHPKGTLRILHDDAGNVVYKQHMHAHYGEFTGTKGRDGDPVDCFVGPLKNAKEVYIVHMLDKGPVKAEREDEDKVFVGYGSPEAAKTAFLLHYPVSFYGGMTCLPVDDFKKKLKTAQLPYHEKKLHAAYNDLVKKSYDVEATPDVLARFERLLAYLQRCSSIGHSTTVGMGIDGDGADRFHVSGVEKCKEDIPDKLQRVEIVAGKKPTKCPHCGSKKFNLMPSDYETAKCSNCHKNFHYGA